MTKGPWMNHGQWVVTGNDAGPIDALNNDDAKAIASLPVVLSAAEEAYHELRVRCGYRPGDHVFDSLAEALTEAIGPQAWIHKVVK